MRDRIADATLDHSLRVIERNMNNPDCWYGVASMIAQYKRLSIQKLVDMEWITTSLPFRLH